MIINDKEAAKRLSSPMNLINKLRCSSNGSKKNNAMSLFGIGKQTEEVKLEISFNPFESNKNKKLESSPARNTTSSESSKPSESLDTILKNSESQIKLGLAHDKALDLLHRSVEILSSKLDDVKADKLPSVISAASKTVESIRRERSEREKNNKDREVHFHFYTPEQKRVEDYEVIDVT